MHELLTELKKCTLVCLSLLFVVLTIGCGSDDPSVPDLGTGEETGFVFFIDGPIGLKLGQNGSYSTLFVDAFSGAETNPTAQWSVTLAGGGDASNIAEINSSGVLTTKSAGICFVKATYVNNGTTYEASLPVEIFGSAGSLQVAPAALIGLIGDSYDLEAVYLGKTENALSVTYLSNNTNVATVTAQGNVSFVGVGETTITVTASSVEGSPTREVPVLVTEVPDVELPIAKVEVNPKDALLFLNESKQFTAKAFSSDGGEVSDVSITWEIKSLETNEEGETIEVGTISSSGLFIPSSFGRAQITAKEEGSGVRSTAVSVTVLPDKVVIIEPFSTSIAAGASLQFEALVYDVDQTTKNLNTQPAAIQPEFTYSMLDFGFPELFGIGSVDASGLVTINENAAPGMPGFLLALVDDPTIAPGISLITVGIASSCDCGEKLQDAASIAVDPMEINLSLFGVFEQQITAQVYDGGEVSINGATINYCSSNELVVDVDENGLAVAVGQGDAVITVCHGDLSQEINVSVSF